MIGDDIPLYVLQTRPDEIYTKKEINSRVSCLFSSYARIFFGLFSIVTFTADLVCWYHLFQDPSGTIEYLVLLPLAKMVVLIAFKLTELFAIGTA